MAEPSVVWDLANVFGEVPYPVHSKRLEGWASMPRRFGCVSARRSVVWYVLGSDPRCFCVSCAVRMVREASHCQGCSKRAPLNIEVVESGQTVFISWVCRRCKSDALG